MFSFGYSTHCPKNDPNLCLKRKHVLVTAETNALVYSYCTSMSGFSLCSYIWHRKQTNAALNNALTVKVSVKQFKFVKNFDRVKIVQICQSHNLVAGYSRHSSVITTGCGEPVIVILLCIWNMQLICECVCKLHPLTRH